jgi:peptidoglycan/xylan/chitin deacetylase (PgdA/CDA1 family)/GT2 family glycosyltransferase
MSGTDASETLQISVVIPTYNGASRLGPCLQALAAQTQPSSDFEVILVVDGSTDGTNKVIAESSLPYRLRVLWQENKGQAVALNLGAEHAFGRYLLFLDDDILADPRLIAEHLRVQHQQDAVVMGQIRLKLSHRADWFARGFAVSWHSHYERLNRQGAPPSWTDCYGGNVSVPRIPMLQAGGFATDLQRGYDIELGYRLAQLGLPIVYEPDGIGIQQEHKMLKELTRDAELAGSACVRLWQRFPEMLPQLLGSFNEAKPRERLVRRALLACNVSPRSMAWIGSLLPKPAWTLRLYRFLYNYCYWRGVRRAVPDNETWRRLTHDTLILMYHAFGTEAEEASRFILPVRRFARQMAWLSRFGYNVLGLEEFLRYRQEHRLAPAPSLIITIDDGYQDNFTLAFPILRRHKFPATIFLVSQKLGQDNHWDEGSTLTGRPLVALSQVNQMFREGIHFGAHTQTHPHLTALSREKMQQEIHGSKQDLQKMLQIPVETFAYPYGDFNASVKEVVEEAGFRGSCSVEGGTNSPKTPSHILRRVEVYGTDSLFRFFMMLLLEDPLWRHAND